MSSYPYLYVSVFLPVSVCHCFPINLCTSLSSCLAMYAVVFLSHCLPIKLCTSLSCYPVVNAIVFLSSCIRHSLHIPLVYVIVFLSTCYVLVFLSIYVRHCLPIQLCTSLYSYPSSCVRHCLPIQLPASLSSNPAVYYLETENLQNRIQEMPKKSCDLDPIPTPVVYDCLIEIIPIVTNIIGRSLSYCIAPQCFKHALVKPVCKTTSPDPNTTAFAFLVQVLVLKQFLQHLESFSLLEHFQPAYRKCHNTETALLRVVNDLLQAFDSGCVSILSLLDPSAAFETTDHSILITRLRATFGCSGTVLDWFISNLSCRTQSVFVGHESTPSVLQCGVPLGSGWHQVEDEWW